MKLRTLRLRHFRAHADTTIEFPSTGVVGVIGNNGSGKSTILESIGFALYGVEATRGSKGSLRWNRAPARRKLEVELTFELAGTTYIAHRTDSDAQLRVADGEIIASGTSAVNAFMPKVLGMNWPEWSSSYLCEQKALTRISAMRPTERLQFIRSVMGLTRIDRALERCRERRNALRNELDGLQAGLGERTPLADEAESAERAVLEAEGALRAAKSAAVEATRLAGDAAEALSASDLRRKRHDDLAARRAEAQREMRQAQEEERRIGEQLEAAHAARARLKEHEPALAKLPALRAQREELRIAEARQGERRALLDRLCSRAADVEDLRQQVARADEVIAAHDEAAWQTLRERYAATEKRLQELREARIGAQHTGRSEAKRAFEDEREARDQVRLIREQGPDEPCPICTRPLGTHHAAVLAQLESEAAEAAERREHAEARAQEMAEPDDVELEQQVLLDELRKQGEQLRSVRDAAGRASGDLQLARRKLDIAEEEVAGIEARLANLPGVVVDAARLARVTARIGELEALDRSLAPDRDAAGRIQFLLDQREQWRIRYDNAEGRIDAAGYDLELLHFDAGEHARIQDEAEQARAGRETARAEEARATEALTAANARLYRANAAIEAYDARAAAMRKLADQHRVHDRAATVLDAFRRAAAAKIRPELEELTSGFVALLTDGRHEAVTLDEDFAVTLQEAGVAVEVISGGTEDVAALALRLAVSQAIAERAGHPLSLLVLDEPFGSLDAVRRGNVLDLIRRLGSVFQQVLLISHVEETRDACDHAILVEYDEAAGCSRVVQSSIPTVLELEPAGAAA